MNVVIVVFFLDVFVLIWHDWSWGRSLKDKINILHLLIRNLERLISLLILRWLAIIVLVEVIWLRVALWCLETVIVGDFRSYWHCRLFYRIKSGVLLQFSNSQLVSLRCGIGFTTTNTWDYNYYDWYYYGCYLTTSRLCRATWRLVAVISFEIEFLFVFRFQISRYLCRIALNLRLTT